MNEDDMKKHLSEVKQDGRVIFSQSPRVDARKKKIKGFKKDKFKEMDKKQLVLLLNKSLAFLEVACISSLQKDNELYNTYEYSDVITYLLLHSTELFLKFAILAKTPMNSIEEKLDNFNHLLTVLHKEYKDLYPGEEYDVDIIFDDEAFKSQLSRSELKIYNVHKNHYNAPMDISTRYPLAKDGVFYDGAYGYIFESSFLEKRRELFKTIGSKIIDNLDQEPA